MLRRFEGPALGDAALHTRSADARALLARAAGPQPVAELIEAARAGARVDGADSFGLGELARVVALQELNPTDRADGLALFDLLLRSSGADQVAPAHQGLHTQLAYAAGRRDRAAELLRLYPDVNAQIRAGLAVDLGVTPFGRLLPDPAPVLVDGPGAAFDRLHPGTAPLVGSPHRITTIVTTYQPGPGLLTAVRSLIGQTWTHHEILVVDDGSGRAYDDVLHRAAALDPRVRVLRMPVNGGTYVARNAGLDAATGEFVTFQDSDDWSHPLRLQRQAEALLADPALLACTSVGMRVGEQLVVTRPGWDRIRTYNLSSLMLRRGPALARLGYLDPVRKGADAEYVERARAVFGRPAVRHLTGAPLALIRLSAASLSSADTGPGWLHPARRAYLSAFQAWHTTLAADPAAARRPARPVSRVFAAPRRLAGDAASRPEHYDVILAGDWTTAGGAATAGTGQLAALVARGRRVALLHLDVLASLTGGPRNLDPEAQRLINAGDLDQVVLSDEVRADLVVVRTPDVLQFAPGTRGGIRAARVVIEVDAAGNRLPVEVCTAASVRLFGVGPQWSPGGPADRRVLGAGPAGTAMSPVDLPGTVDPRRWRTARPGLRGDRPVVGRQCVGDRAEWRRLREAVPERGELDVRLLHPTGRVHRTWLVYRPDDLSLRAFLDQLDFYLHLPAEDASRDADPTVLTALAAGCVLVLPHRYAPTFGAAAVYAEADDLEAVLLALHRDRDGFRAQSARGRDFVRLRHGHDRYAEQIVALAG